MFEIVTMLYITPPGLIYLMTRSMYILPTFTHLALVKFSPLILAAQSLGSWVNEQISQGDKKTKGLDGAAS